jgi:hypothetical protein
MFEKDVDFLRQPSNQLLFINKLCSGLNCKETCAELSLNVAALLIARREFPAFDDLIKQAQAGTIDLLVDKLLTIR